MNGRIGFDSGFISRSFWQRNFSRIFAFFRRQIAARISWIATAIEGARYGRRMMTDDALGNAAYYRHREASELELASKAPAEDIRKIHLQLARRYAGLADESEAEARANSSSSD
ncbi:hypothetical protein LZ518_03975 [Sphingomonas sp. RB56-2]|uniref:Uncharacterized protein n=1 Tax=Sphingomonas brevis TaxID=2908206 RepID=A0ABT0S7B8_9SPHN|nr:hypothetical protein [Sphingomonas brevis]MCL6740291.1 hypothetical protein [Sphingomonas brevis]